MGIKKLREDIDKIDDNILKLLDKRMKVALRIGKEKKKKKGEVYIPNREREVYSRIVDEKKRGVLSRESVLSIYREIMSATIALQSDVKVAYFGPEATFTHLASVRKFGGSVDYVPVKTIKDVFIEVEKGRANYGVVPIENSTEGVVNYTLDMFIESDLKICSEIMFEIHHNLLSKERSVKSVKRIYGNPQSFAQCRMWLEDNVPNVEFVEVSSTAEAARVAAQDRKTAAISSELAAKLYGLRILVKKIEDFKHNYTRFLVIGKGFGKRTGDDKTSIMFSIKDKVGALYDMLLPFKQKGINLTSIESRPSKKKTWDYYFFVDLKGHCEDPIVKKALKQLSKDCLEIKVLGSYPVG